MSEELLCLPCNEPLSPSIFMMRDSGGDEDQGWQNVEDAPISVERGENMRAADPDVVTTSDGECVQRPRAVPEPRTPSPDLVARHNLTHLPYASWCPHCVAARRANNPHFQREETFRRMIPLLVLDYCFVRNTQDEDLLPLLVGRIYPTRTVFAFPVDMKGRDPVAVAKLSEFIKANGLTKFVYKCDQERALDALSESAVEDALLPKLIEEAAQRIGRVATPADEDDVRIAVPENSPVGESQSNGKSERTVQMVEDQIRTMKLALEARIGARIPCSHPLMHWVVMHCADILNKYTVNRTGHSPYEETHGQKAPEKRVELGERVFYYTPKKGRRKLDPRWRLGVYLGHTGGSMEAYVGVPNGNVRMSRTVLRVVAESRWSKEMVQRVLGTPHELTPIDDGELNSDDIDASEQPYEPNEDTTAEPPADGSEANAPRRVRITAKDLKKHGFTVGCPRCIDLERGKANSVKNHSEQCRARLYKKFEDEEHDKYARVREERERGAPARDFFDFDPADYDKWLAREVDRENLLRPHRPEESEPEARRASEPEAKRARTRMRPHDRDCDFDEDSGLYVPSAVFRSKNLLKPDLPERHPDQCTPADHPDRNWHFPPTDHRHHRGLMGEEDDDEDVTEPTAKKARQFALTMNALVNAGVDPAVAKKHCAALTGQLPEASFVELYGRGAVVDEANGPRRNLNVRGLSAFDMRTMKPTGDNWDFNKASDRKLCLKIIGEMNPDFVIGSPPCTPWCVWNQHMNFKKMDPEKVRSMLAEGRTHLEFVARVYRRQIKNGKLFLHEQPATALSWDEKCILELIAHGDVKVVQADQC